MTMLLLALAAFVIPCVLGSCKLPDGMSGWATDKNNMIWAIYVDIPQQIALLERKDSSQWKYYDYKTMKLTSKTPNGCEVIDIEDGATLPAVDPSKDRKTCIKRQTVYVNNDNKKLHVDKSTCLPVKGDVVQSDAKPYEWTYSHMTAYVHGRENSALYKTERFKCSQ